MVDTAQCKRDFALMAELGTNAIRVYHVDPKANHDGCMEALAAAGIYLFVDLDTFDTSINQVKTHIDFSWVDLVLTYTSRTNHSGHIPSSNDIRRCWTSSKNITTPPVYLLATR